MYAPTPDLAAAEGDDPRIQIAGRDAFGRGCELAYRVGGAFKMNGEKEHKDQRRHQAAARMISLHLRLAGPHIIEGIGPTNHPNGFAVVLNREGQKDHIVAGDRIDAHAATESSLHGCAQFRQRNAFGAALLVWLWESARIWPSVEKQCDACAEQRRPLLQERFARRCIALPSLNQGRLGSGGRRLREKLLFQVLGMLRAKLTR